MEADVSQDGNEFAQKGNSISISPVIHDWHHKETVNLELLKIVCGVAVVILLFSLVTAYCTCCRLVSDNREILGELRLSIGKYDTLTAEVDILVGMTRRHVEGAESRWDNVDIHTDIALESSTMQKKLFIVDQLRQSETRLSRNIRDACE